MPPPLPPRTSKTGDQLDGPRGPWREGGGPREGASLSLIKKGEGMNFSLRDSKTISGAPKTIPGGSKIIAGECKTIPDRSSVNLGFCRCWVLYRFAPAPHGFRPCGEGDPRKTPEAFSMHRLRRGEIREVGGPKWSKLKPFLSAVHSLPCLVHRRIGLERQVGTSPSADLPSACCPLIHHGVWLFCTAYKSCSGNALLAESRCRPEGVDVHFYWRQALCNETAARTHGQRPGQCYYNGVCKLCPLSGFWILHPHNYGGREHS